MHMYVYMYNVYSIHTYLICIHTFWCKKRPQDVLEQSGLKKSEGRKIFTKISEDCGGAEIKYL